MSIMFLEGAYPSPGEAHQGRLQLVEVSLHTRVMLLERTRPHVEEGQLL